MAELLRTSAHERPNDVAIRDEYGALTWRTFNDHVNELIHFLRRVNVRQGDTIAILSRNRREFLEVATAATHASLIYVPMNWHWVSRELAYVLSDADVKALFVEDRFADVAREALDDSATSQCATRVVFGEHARGFDAYDDLVRGVAHDEPRDQASGGPMFYTSGTTGFPKGVRSNFNATGQSLARVQNLAAAVATVLKIPPRGVTLLDGPAYHSAQLALSLYPLLGLASSVVTRAHFDAASMLDLIDDHQVTNVHLVPTQFIRLLKLDDEVRARFDGSSLASVIHGAAPCPPSIKRAMLEWWGPVILEYYGGTESGFLTVADGPTWLAHPGTVGRVLASNELVLMNDDYGACAPGEVGQIYFKSLSGGDFRYHKSPDKTAAAHFGEGLGTLGDVGYLDDDGYLFLSDRKIDMIISGGVNIYPAEIEGVLVTHPAVADVAVFGVPDDEMGEQVKAAVELVEPSLASAELASEIQTFARAQLASFKVPRSIDFVVELPRHPTGKLYKRLLRDAYWPDAERQI
ncbi:MAG TPA: AMP-binding protein [Acidimicrobiales bacterium]|nr:MAG: hypothetical protein B7X07_02490 [Actinobacteria bacterium 21-64-8]HQT99216.1 AMP-binding protein [Acidimicrobiales bacterium]